jgi:hypothetical protein
MPLAAGILIGLSLLVTAAVLYVLPTGSAPVALGTALIGVAGAVVATMLWEGQHLDEHGRWEKEQRERLREEIDGLSRRVEELERERGRR